MTHDIVMDLIYSPLSYITVVLRSSPITIPAKIREAPLGYFDQNVRSFICPRQVSYRREDERIFWSILTICRFTKVRAIFKDLS